MMNSPETPEEVHNVIKHHLSDSAQQKRQAPPLQQQPEVSRERLTRLRDDDLVPPDHHHHHLQQQVRRDYNAEFGIYSILQLRDSQNNFGPERRSFAGTIRYDTLDQSTSRRLMGDPNHLLHLQQQLHQQHAQSFVSTESGAGDFVNTSINLDSLTRLKFKRKLSPSRKPHFPEDEEVSQSTTGRYQTQLGSTLGARTHAGGK